MIYMIRFHTASVALTAVCTTVYSSRSLSSPIMAPQRRKKRPEMKKICHCTPFCGQLLTARTRRVHRTKLGTRKDEEYGNNSELELEDEGGCAPAETARESANKLADELDDGCYYQEGYSDSIIVDSDKGAFLEYSASESNELTI